MDERRSMYKIHNEHHFSHMKFLSSHSGRHRAKWISSTSVDFLLCQIDSYSKLMLSKLSKIFVGLSLCMVHLLWNCEVSKQTNIYKYTHMHTHEHASTSDGKVFSFQRESLESYVPTHMFWRSAHSTPYKWVRNRDEIWCFCAKLDFCSLKMCSCPLMIVRLTADSMIFFLLRYRKLWSCID